MTALVLMVRKPAGRPEQYRTQRPQSHAVRGLSQGIYVRVNMHVQVVAVPRS